MTYFHYQNNQLYVENVACTTIANEFGTPCYVYSARALEDNWNAFDHALQGMKHRICYAVKANSNLGILNLFAKKNSGFDIVSIGELRRVLAAGGDVKKVVFSGVGKSSLEIADAINTGIACFNVESEAELTRLQEIAQQKQKIISIALRVNPNIDARTHPYIATGLHDNKFGIELNRVIPICHDISAMPNLKLIGIGCHIGSQLTDLEPFMEAMECLMQLVNQITALGFHLEHIDIGGGLGVCYQNEKLPTVADYISALKSKMTNPSLEIILEPGRAMVANAGILLTKVEYLKHTDHKNFAIVDAGMNDLIRPALYEAWQNIIPVTQNSYLDEHAYDVVGPVCESADFLGKKRNLAIEAGDLLAVCSAGAYGFSMSSNYNSRPRAAEILIDGSEMHLIRRRETIEDLFAHEKII